MRVTATDVTRSTVFYHCQTVCSVCLLGRIYEGRGSANRRWRKSQLSLPQWAGNTKITG